MGFARCVQLILDGSESKADVDALQSDEFDESDEAWQSRLDNLTFWLLEKVLLHPCVLVALSSEFYFKNSEKYSFNSSDTPGDETIGGARRTDHENAKQCENSGTKKRERGPQTTSYLYFSNVLRRITIKMHISRVNSAMFAASSSLRCLLKSLRALKVVFGWKTLLCDCQDV